MRCSKRNRSGCHQRFVYRAFRFTGAARQLGASERRILFPSLSHRGGFASLLRESLYDCARKTRIKNFRISKGYSVSTGWATELENSGRVGPHHLVNGRPYPPNTPSFSVSSASHDVLRRRKRGRLLVKFAAPADVVLGQSCHDIARGFPPVAWEFLSKRPGLAA